MFCLFFLKANGQLGLGDTDTRGTSVNTMGDDLVYVNRRPTMDPTDDPTDPTVSPTSMLQIYDYLLNLSIIPFLHSIIDVHFVTK